LKELVAGPQAGKKGVFFGGMWMRHTDDFRPWIMNPAFDPNGTKDSQSTLENPARPASFESSLTSAWTASAGGIAAALLLPQTLSAGSPSPSTVTAPAASPWSVATSAGIKTGYDDNVLLQDFGDQANRESWVNALGARLSANYQSSPLFKVLISYAPDFTIYEGESTENQATHRGMLNLSGSGADLKWEMLNSVTRINGDNLGPTYTLNGGTLPAEIPIIGGMDMGYEAWNKTWLVAGVRVGHQKQYQLLGESSPFSNDYCRNLANIEGSPVEWLKLNVLAEPDFRDYDNTTPAGFNADQNYVFFDAAATITPTKVDAIVGRTSLNEASSRNLYRRPSDSATAAVIGSRSSVGKSPRITNASAGKPIAKLCAGPIASPTSPPGPSLTKACFRMDR
jgi:hypothetical protein